MRTSASLLTLLICLQLGCNAEKEWPDHPLLLICPWAVGGGTDRVSRQVGAFLELELGVPVNVINATGGAGVTGHSRIANAKPDGYTLGTITAEINILRWRHLTRISWEDYTPIMLVNSDAAAVFVRKDSPWQSVADLTAAVRAQPGKLTSSGTATCGIWHLALAGYLRTAGLEPTDITWVPSKGSAPSLQDLASGGVDTVCCSIPEARALLGTGEIRCLGIMAEERLAARPNVPTFREQGVDWSLGGWRGIALPLDVDEKITARLVSAFENIVTGKTKIRGESFPAFMEREGFGATWLGPEDFRDLLGRADKDLGALITSDEFSALLTDKFRPYDFPFLLIGILVVLLGASAIKRRRSTAATDAPPQAPRTPATISKEGASQIALVIACVVVFLLCVETVGFILAATGLLLILLWRLGTRLVPAVLVTLVVVPLLYHVFVHLLRVSLPRGYLGW